MSDKKKLEALQERNHKAMLYLAKVNPDRYELEYKESKQGKPELTLTEYAQAGDGNFAWKFPFREYTLNTK